MEFPHLGAHCSYSTCNKLDFLPMKCDGCRTLFCSEHFAYPSHGCAGGRRDVQVPLCPLCGAAVPGAGAPDAVVSDHIDRDCRADPAVQRRAKVFAHRCSYSTCRTRELVPLKCAACGLNHCLRHRHPADHACRPAGPAERAALAATKRLQTKPEALTMRPHEDFTRPQATTVRPQAAIVADIQGDMTEDEALARALSLSMQPEPVPSAVPQRCALS